MTKLRLFQTTVLVSSVLIMGVTAAHAGFEWKGPATPPPASYGADIAPSVANPENFPAPIEWAGPTPAMPAEKVQNVESMPVAPAVVAPAMPPSIMNPAPVMDTVVADTPGEEILSGFGADLPLVIALQQIVPPGYQYSFSHGVDAGTTVSWEGGKTWQNVLADTLTAKGLGYTLKGNTLTVVSGASSATAPASVSTMPAFDPAPVAANEKAIEQSLPPVTYADTAPLPLSAPAMSVSGIEFLDAPKRVADPTAPITIRRQKPSSLLQRPNRVDRTIGQNAIAEGPHDILPKISDFSYDDRTAQSKAEKRTAEKDAAVKNVAVQKQEAAPELAVTEAAPVVDAVPAETQIDENAPIAIAPQSMEPIIDTTESVRQTVTTDDAGQPILAEASWHGARGSTLRDVIKNWSDVAGVELYWSIDYDYRLTEDVGYPGTYDEAIGKLLDRFAAVRPQPFGQLHQSNDGPRVLVIKSYDLIQ